MDKGLSLEEWWVLAQALLSAFGDFPSSIEDLRAGDLWEVSRSEGDAGTASCHPGELEGPRLRLPLIEFNMICFSH